MQGIFWLKCAALVSNMVSHPEIGGDVGRFGGAIFMPVVSSRLIFLYKYEPSTSTISTLSLIALRTLLVQGM